MPPVSYEVWNGPFEKFKDENSLNKATFFQWGVSQKVHQVLAVCTSLKTSHSHINLRVATMAFAGLKKTMNKTQQVTTTLI